MGPSGVTLDEGQRLQAELACLARALSESPERFATSAGDGRQGEEIERMAQLAKLADAAVSARDVPALGRTVGELVNAIAARSRHLVESGSLAAALDLDRHAVAVRRAQSGSSPLDLAETLRNLARDHFHLGNYASAARLAEEAAAIASEHLDRNDQRIVSFLDGAAGACEQLGKYEQAQAYAERALGLAEACFGPQDPRIVPALHTLESVFRAVGRLQDAYAAAARALQIHRDGFGENSFPTARALARLAVITGQIGDTARAAEMFGEALERLRRLPQDRMAEVEIATVLTNLAGLAEPDRAVSLYEEALGLRRRICGPQHPETLRVLSHLGLLHCQGGELDRALAEWNECLAGRRAIFGDLHPDVARTLIDVAFVLARRGDGAAARPAVAKALAILGCYDLPAVTARAHALLAAMLAAESVAAAIMFGKLVVNTLQGLREQTAALGGSFDRAFIAAREQPYRQLGDALIVSGRLPEAQQALAMLKELELFEVTLGHVDVRITRTALTPLEMHWAEQATAIVTRLRNEVSSLHGEEGYRSGVIDARCLARGALDGVVIELERWLDAVLHAFRQSERGTALRGTKAVLAGPASPGMVVSGAARLQYLLASDHLRVVLTTRDTIADYEVGFAAGEVHRLVYDVRTGLQKGTDGYLASAQRLYGMLIAPALRGLRVAGARTLIFSLDGVLRYLPLAALHDGRRHLVHEFAIMLAAGPVGGGKHKQTPSGMRACGLGVTRGIGNHPPLHGVRDELSAVIRTAEGDAGLLPGIIRLDEAFTAEALRGALSAPYPVVHISSHFAFRTAQEASSYLLLGDGSRLTLAELAHWSFAGVELMVLSACDTATGGGHGQSGREIEGLGALARHQGARHVIATLWPVRDFTTAVIMRRFYEGWQQAGLAPAEALRQAQLSLCAGEHPAAAPGPARMIREPGDDAGDERWSHPRYWAPYLLMGEPPGPGPDPPGLTAAPR